MTLVVGTAVAAAGLILLVVVVTAVGAHRRGNRLPLSMLSGAVFPVTWTVWYVRDEQPYHRTHPHHLDRS